MPISEGKPEAKPDSRLQLGTYLAFRPSEIPGEFDFYPPPREIVSARSGLTVVLGDVPLPGGVPAPQSGITALYGFQDAIQEMQNVYAAARERQMNVLKVEFKVRVGALPSGTTSFDRLSITRALNTRRLAAPLVEVILNDVNAMIAAETAGSRRKPKFFTSLLAAGVRPDLIVEAVRSQPMFKTINTVIYAVPDGTPRGRQFATTLTDKYEDVTVRGDMPFEVILPRIKKARKAA